jgi:hypothetical protein
MTWRWEYRTIPAGQLMRFACVSDRDEYGSDDAFSLVEFRMNGMAHRGFLI